MPVSIGLLLTFVRYDMLCHEGISLMLNIFRGKAAVPNFRVVAPLEGEIQEIRVDPEVRHLFKLNELRMKAWILGSDYGDVDRKNSTLCLWGDLEKHQIYTGAI